MCGLVLRFALTLHALETWAVAGRPEDFPAIGPETMRAAIAWADYLAKAEHHARERLDESGEGRASRGLVDWIKSKGGTVTTRDLTRGPREYRGDPEGATNALAALVAAGLGRWEVDDHAGGRGRPVDRFRLLSRSGDTGDGDTNSETIEDKGISVAVATVAKPAHTDNDGWGEI